MWSTNVLQRTAGRARIADSSSTNAVSFSSVRTRKRFPSSHVMVGKSVQFGLHQREQLLDCALVSTAPGAEQLGDLLSRGSGRHHTSATRRREVYHHGGIFTARAEAKKKLRSRGGFEAAFPL